MELGKLDSEVGFGFWNVELHLMAFGFEVIVNRITTNPFSTNTDDLYISISHINFGWENNFELRRSSVRWEN